LLLGDGIKPLYSHLLSRYNDGRRFILHFVTAREMYSCVKALESGDAERIGAVERFSYGVHAG
jgi:hypothetical protein